MRREVSQHVNEFPNLFRDAAMDKFSLSHIAVSLLFLMSELRWRMETTELEALQ